VVFTQRLPGLRLTIDRLSGLQPDELTKVVKAVATLYQGLVHHPQRGIGQLLSSRGDPVVGPICHIGQEKPYLRSSDYHFGTIARRLNEILARPSGTIEARLDQYLFLLDVKQAIKGCPHLTANGETYLKHAWLDVSSIFLSADGPKLLDWDK
jgi:hypothetical protein